MRTQHCKEPFVIIQGRRPRAMICRLLDPITGRPKNLSGATAITVSFLQIDGTLLTLSLAGGITIQDTIYGEIQIQLTAAQTALLQTTNAATLEVDVSYGGDPSGCQIANAYSVVASQPNP